MSPGEARPEGDLAPTVSRRILAARLRKLRNDVKLTLDEAAAEVGVSAAKLSRLENEERAPVVADVRKLVELYGVSDAEAADLIELAEGARRPSPIRGWAAAGPERDYYGLEAAASLVRGVEMLQVHGLLQTSAYTRALLEPLGEGDAWPARLDQIIAARGRRQERLLDPHDLSLDVVMHEIALDIAVGSAAVMRDQVAYLLQMTARPNVTLRVLPHSAGATVGQMGGFVMLTFQVPQLRDLVYLEFRIGQMIIDGADEVGRYEKDFTAAVAQALTPAATRALLEANQHRWNAA